MKGTMKIRDISGTEPRIDPDEVTRLLGAQRVSADAERYYAEFADACGKGMPERDCLKYFKRYDSKELPRVTKIIGMLKSINPKTIVDVGSGRGRLLWPMAHNLPNANIICVDSFDWRTDVIKAVGLGGVKRISAIHADICSSGLPDDSADVVVASEVIEHIPNPQFALSEMLRISRKHFIATVPSKADDNPDHLHLFTSESFCAMADVAAEHISKRVSRIVVDYVPNHMTVFATVERKVSDNG